MLSWVASRLARTVYVQGRYDEAEKLAKTSEQLGGRGDAASRIESRSIRAKVLAHRGNFDEAESLAREAVQLAEKTDDIGSQATAIRDLAEVLDLAGRANEVTSLLLRARTLFEQKATSSRHERPLTSWAARGRRQEDAARTHHFQDDLPGRGVADLLGLGWGHRGPHR